MSSPTTSKGHRRVKSLVREFDEATTTSPTSPPSPTSSISSSAYPFPTTSPGPASHSPTHVRRAASVSYNPVQVQLGSPFENQSPTPLSGANGASGIRASTSSPSGLSALSAGRGSPVGGGGGGAHRRTVSLAVRGVQQAVPALGLTVPRSGTSRLGGGLQQVGEEEEVDSPLTKTRPTPIITTNINNHDQHHNHHAGHSHDQSHNGHSRTHSALPAAIKITAPTPIAATAPPLPGPSPEDDEFLPLSPPPGTQLFTVPQSTSTSDSAVSSYPTPPTTASNSSHSTAHARKHSRIHERNLSAFFPRPGQQSSAVGYGDTYQDPTGAGAHGGETAVPSAGSGGMRSVSGGSAGGDEGAKAARRGHHHKHSMSHNFFSFMEPTAGPAGTGNDLLAANAARNGPAAAADKYSSAPSGSSTPGPGATFLPSPSHALPRSKYAGLPGPVKLVLLCAAYLPLATQLALGLGAVQTGLGAVLWIAGQARESLAVTGLGYLIVFDGMGTLGRVCLEMPGNGMELVLGLMSTSNRDKTVRMPFGTHRVVTLAHFSQSIFLLFSAVYVCKESVEHVLMLHGGAEHEGAHGTGHGSMGHGDAGMSGSGSHHNTMEQGIVLPVVLLASAAALSVVSAILLRTHQGLTDAVGPSSLSLARPRPRQVEPGLIDKVGNPFTLTVLVFSVGLVAASFTIPGPQLAPLDKVLALLQSVAMALVAYPAAKATGECLLQTSPPVEAGDGPGGKAGQMAALHSGLRDVQNHPQVVAVEPIHIWQLTPHHPQGSGVSTFFIPGSPTQKRRRQSVSGGGADDGDRATLVVTLHVRVRHDCSDDEMGSVGAFVKERCRSGLRVGRGGGPEGEVTVQVQRAERGEEVRYYEAPVGADRGRRESFGGDMLTGYGQGGGGFEPASFGDDRHDHSHNHGHDHGTGNGHDHGNGHGTHDDHAGHSHEAHAGHSHASHAGHGHGH